MLCTGSAGQMTRPARDLQPRKRTVSCPAQTWSWHGKPATVAWLWSGQMRPATDLPDSAACSNNSKGNNSNNHRHSETITACEVASTSTGAHLQRLHSCQSTAMLVSQGIMLGRHLRPFRLRSDELCRGTFQLGLKLLHICFQPLRNGLRGLQFFLRCCRLLHPAHGTPTC